MHLDHSTGNALVWPNVACVVHQRAWREPVSSSATMGAIRVCVAGGQLGYRMQSPPLSAAQIGNALSLRRR